jgi:hypothetical protein
MTMTDVDSSIRTLEFTKDQRIEAPIEVVFETILEEIGPRNEGMPGHPLQMKIEPWPGGRWYRDLGNNAGHFWGHVQVIKPPTLLEINGPMFMSYPAAGHIRYQLKADGKATVLTLTHRAFGLLADEHITGVKNGWSYQLERIMKSASKR